MSESFGNTPEPVADFFAALRASECGCASCAEIDRWTFLFDGITKARICADFGEIEGMVDDPEDLYDAILEQEPRYTETTYVAPVNVAKMDVVLLWEPRHAA